MHERGQDRSRSPASTIGRRCARGRPSAQRGSGASSHAKARHSRKNARVSGSRRSLHTQPPSSTKPEATAAAPPSCGARRRAAARARATPVASCPPRTRSRASGRSGRASARGERSRRRRPDGAAQPVARRDAGARRRGCPGHARSPVAAEDEAGVGLPRQRQGARRRATTATGTSSQESGAMTSVRDPCGQSLRWRLGRAG